ncbi:hypothetical protein QQS21_001443 [Conoideocrella luteorostrata]|uniref:Endonuclease/exonuclease/phosphatase domain-containing protein n=1 Tax=Conoideocrella luteorostrata TaxID=1105319 RepID=A0AAJ0CX16_9HYPO|nr:hypothetical protein QQS21_001443 [Conoideocrella luteorostrata]
MAPLLSAFLLSLLLASNIVAATLLPKRESLEQQQGSLSVISTNPLQFKYSTSEANPSNWIGLYHASGGGPENEARNESSLKWAYATETAGVTQLPTDGIADGLYKAFFLANNGYRWLSEPVFLSLGKEQPGVLTLASVAPLRFEYKTSRPGAKNWIGLYFASSGGPDAGVSNQASIRWSYAPGSSGSVEFDNGGLGPGQYKAYFLADDKYDLQAVPVQLRIGDPSKYLAILAVDYSRAPLNIKYTTPQPNDRNWIGLYFVDGGGPVNQVQDQPSLVWDWVRESTGEVTLPTTTLSPGKYKAFFLADGGYTWLSEPIIVTVRSSATFDFLVKEVTTKNARQGDAFEAVLSNLVTQPDESTKFAIVGSGGWATVSSAGVLSGTPPSGAGNTDLRLEARNKNGVVASLAVHIPVRPRSSPLVEDLRVMSFNLWFGGTKVNNYHEKQVRFLTNQNVDVVGFQESSGGHGTRLARALGWYSWQGSDVSIVSRYPIAQVFTPTSVAGAVKIELDGPKTEIILWNCHLGYDPYGPYDFCFSRMSLGQVLKREAESGRTPQIQEITTKMKDHLSNADNIPVFLLGDFNAPSHLDWTEATKSQHCNVGDVPWPSSKYPTDAGLIDSFRLTHPNPVANPGNTWSPIYLDNDGRREPLDRIDFVYHKGRKLTVKNSEAVLVGNPTPEPNHSNNEWPSDHKAVLTTYKLHNL